LDTKELLKKVRRIEIKTKGLSNQIFSGEYHSAFKGRGMAFSEVREYMPGDDIRNIDWNVTARFNHPYIKVFEEERELTVMLLVDISGSEVFGTKKQLKKEIITEICAVLSFSVISNNDKVGVILFSDQVEKFIPPKKGRSHILRIIRELIEFEPEHKATDIGEALRYFSNTIKKRSVGFIISDFIDNDFSTPLKVAGKKHDLIALKVYDQREMELPNVGQVKFSDPETGEEVWINTSNKKNRTQYKANALKREKETEDIFKKAGVDFANIATDHDYIKPLMTLFKRREQYG